MAPIRIWVHGEQMTTSDRIEEHSFCYDPDFPPSVAEGQPLVSAVRQKPAPAKPLRRAMRSAATALARRARSS